MNIRTVSQLVIVTMSDTTGINCDSDPSGLKNDAAAIQILNRLLIDAIRFDSVMSGKTYIFQNAAGLCEDMRGPLSPTARRMVVDMDGDVLVTQKFTSQSHIVTADCDINAPGTVSGRNFAFAICSRAFDESEYIHIILHAVLRGVGHAILSGIERPVPAALVGDVWFDRVGQPACSPAVLSGGWQVAEAALDPRQRAQDGRCRDLLVSVKRDTLIGEVCLAALLSLLETVVLGREAIALELHARRQGAARYLTLDRSERLCDGLQRQQPLAGGPNRRCDHSLRQDLITSSLAITRSPDNLIVLMGASLILGRQHTRVEKLGCPRQRYRVASQKLAFQRHTFPDAEYMFSVLIKII
ncbi:hypothetical protein [Burkholderia contaminans]|uniref:hypothetical protein n=1 Tax=Burkholderia contaminans TaxID=488447 RepID=UPI002417BF9A|nr:hypothetical protein [Burkholderia contaminans]WFN14861.1 hypothetical protein LXE92_31920 [Burkholderia contaminans]